VQRRRDKAAAVKLMRKLLKKQSLLGALLWSSATAVAPDPLDEVRR
jgi:hypothetical protein